MIRRQLENIQGNILKGFNKRRMSLIFLQISNPIDVKKWLAAVARMEGREKLIPNTEDIMQTSKKIHAAKAAGTSIQFNETWLHVSFSYAGIKKLGITPPPSHGVYEGIGRSIRKLTENPTGYDPFEQGMKNRWEYLNDIYYDDNWVAPYHVKDANGNDISPEIHVLLIVAADDEGKCEKKRDDLKKEALRNGVFQTWQEEGIALMTCLPNGKKYQTEHFGFHDGISQPEIRIRDEEGPFEPSDFVLSQLRDEKLEWANDGSFLVFQKLEQDVPGFWKFMNEESEHYGITPDTLAARFFGRWKSGAPLANHQNSDPETEADYKENNFSYADDNDGLKTPLFAHIRKVNPRDSKFAVEDHSIIRRGIPYGPKWHGNYDDTQKRGLLFICYQRDIEKQFEYIQRNWANSEAFPGHRRFRPGPDPIAGQHFGKKGPAGFLHNGSPQKMRIKQWVKIVGGGYFFSPSISALRKL